jgi:hypothetical protein
MTTIEASIKKWHKELETKQKKIKDYVTQAELRTSTLEKMAEMYQLPERRNPPDG